MFTSVTPPYYFLRRLECLVRTLDGIQTRTRTPSPYKAAPHSPAYAAPARRAGFHLLLPSAHPDFAFAPRRRGQATFEEGFRRRPLSWESGVQPIEGSGLVYLPSLLLCLTSCVDDASCPSRLSILKCAPRQLILNESGM